MSLPVLALTMGDPAGIGPEITAKALACESLYSECLPFVIGDFTLKKPQERYLEGRPLSKIPSPDELPSLPPSACGVLPPGPALQAVRP